MRLLRSAIVLVLLTSAAVAAPINRNLDLAAAERSTIPVLGENNIVFGSRTAWTRVRLPEALHFEEINKIEKRFKGNGRLVGVFLVEERNGKVVDKGGRFWIARFGKCPTRACEPNAGQFQTNSGWNLDKDSMLRAGIYRLFLVVDGAPVRVSLRIPSYSGQLRINPTRPMGSARAKVQTLQTRLHESTTGIAYAAGNEAPFGGRGIALQEVWVDPIGTGVVKSGLCWYRHEAPADSTTAYLPPRCNVTGPSLFMQHYTPINDGCCFGMSMALDFLPKAMGSWYISSGPVESSGATGLWLRF